MIFQVTCYDLCIIGAHSGPLGQITTGGIVSQYTNTEAPLYIKSFEGTLAPSLKSHSEALCRKDDLPLRLYSKNKGFICSPYLFTLFVCLEAFAVKQKPSNRYTPKIDFNTCGYRGEEENY
jgi:hypothetical protein